MHKGWIRLYRKLEDTPLWKAEPFTKGQAWVDLLFLARHNDGEMIIKNGEIVALSRGDVGASVLGMSERWSWSRGKVKRFLRYLNGHKMIHQKTIADRLVVSICNYDMYQGDTVNDTPNSTPNSTPNGHQTDINNTLKNYKKEEKEENAGKIFQPAATKKPSDKSLKTKKPSSRKRIINLAKQQIFEIWNEISEAWGTPNRTGGKAALSGIERYIRNQDDANRAIEALKSLTHNEPSKFHTENPSNYWSLEWIFRARDSKQNPVDRIQDILDGRMFEENSSPQSQGETTRRYTPVEQELYHCDEFGNLTMEDVIYE